MKNTFFFLITLIVFFSNYPSIAQESGKTVPIIPALGDTLYKVERDFYKLFPNVKDFEYAVFSVGENQSINANVCSKVNGELEFHLYKNYMAGLQNINHYLEQVDKVSASTPGGQEIIVYKTDSTEIKGELICVRHNSILIFPAQEGINLIDDSDLINVIIVKDINKIEFPNERSVLSNCFFSFYTGGAILGTLAGVIASSASQNKSEQNFAPALITVIGIAIGTVIAYFIFSGETDNYEIDGEFDLVNFNEYARFKSFEPLYLRQIE